MIVRPVADDQWPVVAWLWQDFRHDNADAGRFWRTVATAARGDGWVETEEPVPGKPEVPPDHWIRTT